MASASSFGIALGAVVIASCSLGCGGQSNAGEKQIDELRQQLVKVQADHDRFDERLGALESAESRRATSPQGDPGRPTVGSRTTDGPPPLRVVRMNPDGSLPDDNGPGDPPADAPDDGTRTVIRVGKGGTTVSTETAKPADAKSGSANPNKAAKPNKKTPRE